MMPNVPFRIIRLERHYNQKGVSWPGSNIPAQLEHLGIHLPGELLPNDEVVVCGGYPFHFPKTDGFENDHISCEGGAIRIDAAAPYESLAFLGFSRWGDFEDRIDLLYEDGTTESRFLGFTNMIVAQPRFGERPGLTLPYHRCNDDKIETLSTIWLQQVPLHPRKSLRQFTLPDNPYMFIVAITAGRSS